MRTAVVSCLVGASIALVPQQRAEAQTLNDLYPELATLVANDGATNDFFGRAVALSGDTLAVGVPTDDVGANIDQGSVRVFVRTGSSWTLQATLTAADGTANENFGEELDLLGDTLAVGLPTDDVGANIDQGSVRMFVRTGSSWTQQATLTASDGAAGDRFGASVSLSGDTLAVGMPFDDVGAVGNQGSVRVYSRLGASWSLQATLTAADGAVADLFGGQVSLSGDTLAVSVTRDTVGSTFEQGSVRVFVRTGFQWSPQATLTAADGESVDLFGMAISLSGDTLAVGVPFDDVGANADQGSVRVFVRGGTTWTAHATLIAADGSPSEQFGASVSLWDDTLAVGTPSKVVGANQSQGIVSVYERSGSFWGQRLTLEANDGTPLEFFGGSVSLSGDALAVGVTGDAVGTVGNAGSVRVFGNYRVFNDTTNIGYTSLASAIAGSSAGARLIVGAPAFNEATGIVDASQKRFNYVAVEPIAVNSSTLMTVATNTVFEKSPEVAAGGLTVAGDLSAPLGGTLTFEELSVASGGQLLQRGSTLLVNQNLATTSGGVCYLQGAILAEAVTTAVGAQNRCAGDTDVFANYTNAGTTVVQRGILYIYGSLVNTGTITGEVDTNFLPPAPGDGYSIGGDYAVSASSSLILPDPVWWLRVGGDLDIAIDSPSRFVMDEATIELTGLGDAPSQTLEVFARDFGAVNEGFAASNYLLGALRIRAGASVGLVDNHNNATGKGQEAIYTNELFVPAGATLVTNGYRIYTRAATIAGTVSDPADIVVVPGTPPCPADIYADGVVNAADLSALLVAWGPCTGSCTADLDGNGSVGATDLAALLVSWGPCAN